MDRLVLERLTEQKESPEYLQISMAAAMTLGIVPGQFYRNTRLSCINTLLTYPSGCHATSPIADFKRQGIWNIQKRTS